MKHTDNPWPYVIVVFVLSYLWQLFLYFNGGLDSPFFPVMLLFPGVVAIAFRLRNKEGFRNAGWGILAGLCLISLNRKKPVLWQSNEISKKG